MVSGCTQITLSRLLLVTKRIQTTMVISFVFVFTTLSNYDQWLVNRQPTNQKTKTVTIVTITVKTITMPTNQKLSNHRKGSTVSCRPVAAQMPMPDDNNTCSAVSSHHGLTKKRVSQWRLSTRCHKSVTVWFASFSNPDSTAALALPQTPQTNS